MTTTARVLPDPTTIRGALEQVAQYGILGDSDPTIFDVGTGPFLSFIEREVLNDLIARGGATCRFFEGSYGAGKTHLLHLLRGTALERGMATVQTDLSQDLGLDDWYPIAKYILQNLEVRVDGERARGLPRILDALRQSGNSDVAAFKDAPLPHAGFRNAMLRAVTDEEVPFALSQYLLGEKVGTGRLQQAGIRRVKDPLSRRNAELVLCTVTAGLFRLGIPGTMLLFDENERTLATGKRGPSSKLLIAANLMRRLVDGCTTGSLVGTAVIFAVLPDFLQRCAEAYPALGQRLETAPRRRQEPAWRWPVLPVDAATTVRDRAEFLVLAVDRISALVAHCSGGADGVEGRLTAAGEAVLIENAGSGYRRELMKRLATVGLESIERG